MLPARLSPGRGGRPGQGLRPRDPDSTQEGAGAPPVGLCPGKWRHSPHAHQAARAGKGEKTQGERDRSGAHSTVSAQGPEARTEASEKDALNRRGTGEASRGCSCSSLTLNVRRVGCPKTGRRERTGLSSPAPSPAFPLPLPRLLSLRPLPFSVLCLLLCSLLFSLFLLSLSLFLSHTHRGSGICSYLIFPLLHQLWSEPTLMEVGHLGSTCLGKGASKGKTCPKTKNLERILKT